ncbi:hypothetical protein HA402_005582 [Bradysia odoriphaga]|nr:hypothetical protein HA402_005582 [Bradysia odoriphaga]
MDLKGKVALVSGGATGLGRTFCEELLRHGAKVSICDLDSDAGENAQKYLSETFGKDRILFCHCDVTDYVQYEEAFQSTLAEFDGLDIVVNNAEIMNDKFWELEVDVNLNGAIRGTLLGLQFMGRDKGGQGGVVVNIGSAASFRPQVFSPPIYTATKHAILGLSRSCGDAYHYSTSGVRVIALCPGLLCSENGSAVPQNNKFKSPAHEKAWHADMKGVVPQSMEHVAKALMTVVKEAASGSVWLIANGTPPKEIPFSHETL